MTVPLLRYPDQKPKNYFALQKAVLRTLGISFSANETARYKFYSFIWLSSVIISFSLVELYELYVYKDDMDIMINNLSYLGTDLLGIAKMSVLLYHRLNIGKILDRIEEGELAPNKLRGGDLEEKLIKRCILFSNRQACVYYFSVAMVVLIGAASSLLKRIFQPQADRWEMPFTTFSWFNTDSSPIFEIIWFYQFCWRAFYALIVSSIDSLIAGILAHVSVQCKILQNAVEKAIPYTSQENIGVEEDNMELIHRSFQKHILAQKIKEIVTYHSAIIDLASQFEELFNFLILTIFLTTLFILCFVMYHASLFDLLNAKAAQDFCYVVLVAIQVFLYCHWGNEVRLESVKVAAACWQTDFVQTNPQFQKSLSLVIRRSQKPILLTAGKFTTLSLETYVWIIRLSYSYYMVLRNYHK